MSNKTFRITCLLDGHFTVEHLEQSKWTPVFDGGKGQQGWEKAEQFLKDNDNEQAKKAV